MADHNFSNVLRSPPEDWQQWLVWLQLGLHGRSQWRLPLVLAGLLWARQRRTVSSWLRAARLQAKYTDYYYFNGSVGRKTNQMAARLLSLLLRLLPLPERIILALDDSPTARYGPKVEGAGLHHNPTSGPDDHKFIYGHIWVTLALVLRHPRFGPLALPLRAMLYVRRKTMAKIPKWRGWTFATKLVLAARLVEWIAPIVKKAGKTLWLVVDGGYVKEPFLKRALRAGATVLGRLRKDAALRDLPRKPRRGRRRGRGRPPKYGKNKISLAKRAAHREGWQTAKCTVYGKTVTKLYKTFLATYRPVGGLIRVVIVLEDHDWFPFFSTDPNATAVEIIEGVADRATIEQDFHDVKEVWGAGQQQVRNIWTNLAVYHLNLWIHTLVELWCWNRCHAELCDRSLSPWDDADRRPSHADRRKALRRQIIEHELSTLAAVGQLPQKILQLTKRLVALAT
jgi:hypothetical protein